MPRRGAAKIRYPALLLCGVLLAGTFATALSAAPNPLRMTGIAVQGGSVVLRWAGGTGPYQLLCRTNVAQEWTKFGQPTSGTSSTNPASSGPACFYMVTTDMSPPATPTGVRVTTNSCSQVTVSWNPAFDNVGGAGMKTYTVYRNGTVLRQVNAISLSTVDAGLNGQTAYSYAVSATDIVGNQSAASAPVSVTMPSCNNYLPIASAGADQNATAGHTVNFSADNSYDPDGSIVSYLWNFGDGAGAVGLSTAHAFASSGVYMVTLTVTDNAGATANDNLVVTVGNTPPVASAGADQTSPRGSAVNFSAAGSYDADGSIVSYSWDFGDGTSATGATASRTYANAGAYTVTLTVTDNFGATGSDSALVNVVNLANLPPVAVAGSDQSSVPGRALSFSSTGSYDPDGTIVSYAWNFGDGSSATGATASRAYANSGTYTVTLTVTDNSGASASDTAQVTVSPPASSGQFVSFTKLGAGDSDAGLAVAVDSTGHVLLGGNVAYRPYVARRSPSGAVLWSINVGGGLGGGNVQAVAADSHQNVIIAGNFTGALDFGTGPLTSAGGYDIFVAKYTPAGVPVWAYRFGGPSLADVQTDSVWGLAVDTNTDAVIITGAFEQSVDFGTDAMTSPAGDMFLAKLSSAGVTQWARRANCTGGGSGRAVALDGSGNIFLTGTFTGTANFGLGNITALGVRDAFVAKYSPTGAGQWAKCYGTNSPWRTSSGGAGIAVDRFGNVIVAGSYGVSTSFGGALLPCAGYEDVFLAKYSGNNGAHQWSQRFGGALPDAGNAVAVDNDGNIALAGSIRSGMDFGGGFLPALPGQSGFAASYSPTGAHRWSKLYGAGNENSKGIATGPDGQAYVIGRFAGTVDFGGGPITAAGSWDLYLVEFAR